MAWHLLSSQWLWMGLTVALLVSDVLVFILMPRWARRLAAQGQTARAVRVLARVVRLPSVAGDGVKLDARYTLGLYLSNERRFGEAVAQWQTLLAQDLPPSGAGVHGLEADVRRRLADCLEALGQTGEAEQERERARGSLAGSMPTPLSWLSQGKLLKDQRKYAEAYAAFEQGLALVKPNAKPQQVEFMAQLMLTAFDSGRPDLTVQWAERAIANGANGVTGFACWRMAGVGYSDQGNLESAERCYHHARELALSAHDVKQEEQARVTLAGVQQKRGKLTEAMQECRALIEAGPTSDRTAYIIHAECLRDLGRFDEALDVMHQGRNAPGYAVPAQERRMQAVYSLGMAWIASTAERPGEALAFLREAAGELGREEKLALWVSATGARIHAQMEQREDSEALAQAVLRALPKYASDRATLKLAYSSLARAAYSLGDWARSQELWTLYFAQEPYPNGLPVGWYYQGECALALGDEAGARAKFQEAQTVNLEFYHARLARRRLDEITT